MASSRVDELDERLRARETDLVRWLQEASPEEKDALVDLLVALELGQTRN